MGCSLTPTRSPPPFAIHPSRADISHHLPVCAQMEDLIAAAGDDVGKIVLTFEPFSVSHFKLGNFAEVHSQTGPSGLLSHALRLSLIRCPAL